MEINSEALYGWNSKEKRSTAKAGLGSVTNFVHRVLVNFRFDDEVINELQSHTLAFNDYDHC